MDVYLHIKYADLAYALFYFGPHVFVLFDVSRDER